MKLISKAVLFLNFFSCVYFLPSASFAEWTIFQPISRVQYNGNLDFAFFVGASKWGASSCPNASYVQVKSDVPGRKQLLSIALATKIGGQKVQFIGDCDGNPDYFNAYYIIVE